MFMLGRCPKCGRDDAELSYDGDAWVMCPKCGTSTQRYASIHEAVCAWNSWAEYADMFAETVAVINGKIAV